MALYFYQGFSRDGKRVSGYLDASSLQSVKEQLIKQQIYPSSIALAHQEARIPWWKRLFAGRVSAKDKILFTKQLAILLKAGVPLLQALELLTEYFEGQFQAMLTIIKDDVKEGRALNEALAKYPKAFDSIYVQLVRAGEASGKLEMILERLTAYLERQEEIRKKISAALREPAIQLGMAVVVITVMMTAVVPGMAEAFEGSGKELPASTELVMAISNIFVNYYLFLIAGIISLVGGLMYWRSTKSGKLYIDRLMLRLPFVSYFAKTRAIVQFTQTLGILTESGVNLAESLDIVCKIIDNQVLADALNEARDKIIKQGKIAQYLKQTGIFPPIAIYLINTGEESGKLDTMLLTVAKNYEDELTERIDGLTAAIGPIMLVVMGLIVGFIVLSIAEPLTQMSDIS
jgi:type IV pilus assembly protein PilC